MQKKEVIRLSREEMEKIMRDNKKIGEGLDGVLYKDNNVNNVLKFYKDSHEIIDAGKESIYDGDGVNITDYKLLRNKTKGSDNRILNYVDENGVILAREEAILKAIELGDKVKKTYLPNHIIYVDNKAVGCVYPYYNTPLGIYASAYMPLRRRLQVCKQLIVKVQELLDNNIYPLSLAQRSDKFPVLRKDSNVLLDLNGKVNIVDLDGNSTLYSENYSHTHTSLTLASLSTLVLEIISKIKIYDDNIYDQESLLDPQANEAINEYIESVIDEFVKVGIPENIACKYYEYGKLEMNDIKRLVRSVEKKHR